MRCLNLAAYNEVAGEIVRFAQQYPLAQVVVTSRIIGYNPDRLQHAEFRHWTLQPLENEEITEFIQRWYDLALGDDDDKPRLVQQLQEAINRSKSIENLADNPLLLTMMAILNRHQPLPRDRAELYDRCTRVLLHNWDIDHKRLQLPFDAIGRQEKQAMLRRLAYEMQASEKGLAGNLIEDERLKQILTAYMREQGFSEPREKAGKLIRTIAGTQFHSLLSRCGYVFLPSSHVFGVFLRHGNCQSVPQAGDGWGDVVRSVAR